jgi:uncharacterized protein
LIGCPGPSPLGTREANFARPEPCYAPPVMKAPPHVRIPKSILDPQAPWKLPRLPIKFRAYTKSPAEWNTLLAKAKAGDTEAQCEVAALYGDGCKDRRGRHIVRPSKRKAFLWYRRAAELGDASAQLAVGNFISGGQGGARKNLQEGVHWYRRAIRGESTCAARNIAITYRLNGQNRLAVKWFRNGAAQKNDDDWIQLGIHSFWGIGTRRDASAAIRMFRRAAKGKNLSESDRDDANFYLAIAYLEGNGVKRSFARAIEHLECANRDGDHLAAQRLLRWIQKLR